MDTLAKHPELLSAIDAYCQAHSVSQSRFGEMFLRDPRFVSDLRKGRELRRATEARVWESLKSPPAKADGAAA